MNPRKTYLLTKHFKTSSCLQTNSMKRGEVILLGIKKHQNKWTEIGDTANLVTIHRIRLVSSKRRKKICVWKTRHASSIYKMKKYIELFNRGYEL